MADPITAADLLRILKGEGLDVRTYKAGWSQHERDAATGKAFGPIHGVMIHHTGGLNVGNFIWTGSAALPGPLAHAYIDKRGVVWMMSDGRANHAGGGDPAVLKAVTDETYNVNPPKTKYGEGDKGAVDGNDCFYGFECENKGDGKDPWPVVQVNAMVKAAAAIVRYYRWTEKSIIGHLEWNKYKVDPKGWPMAQFRGDVKDCLAQPPGVWPSKGGTKSSTNKGATVAGLSDADVEKIFTQDGTVPAARPPYANDDYATNKDWRAGYALQTTVEGVRNALTQLATLQAKVDEILTKLNSQ